MHLYKSPLCECVDDGLFKQPHPALRLIGLGGDAA